MTTDISLPSESPCVSYARDSLLIQLTAKAGVEKFGIVAINAIHSELEQFHGCTNGKPNGRPV